MSVAGRSRWNVPGPLRLLHQYFDRQVEIHSVAFPVRCRGARAQVTPVSFGLRTTRRHVVDRIALRI
jgi:hypothetical protein